MIKRKITNTAKDKIQINTKNQQKNVPKISGGMCKYERCGTFFNERFGAWKIAENRGKIQKKLG